jgi:AraC-like DNA-binding protein
MIDSSALSRLYFDLSETKPIHIILHTHQDLNEGWFDMHYEFELGVVLSGRMKRKYLEHEMEAGPGEVWLCGMWEPHGFELLETPCELLIFVIDPTYVASSHFLNRNILAPFQAFPPNRPQIVPSKRELFLKRAQTARNRFAQEMDADWSKLIFFELMLHLLEDWQPTQETSRNFASQQSVQPALKLVFEQRRFVSTQEAARQCTMSVTAFRAVFQDLMGISFADFALQYRMKGAMTQLQHSQDTLEKIALDWGFTDASHLHKYIGKQSKQAAERILH